MLDRETFQKGIRSEPRLMNIVMGDFAKRIRRMDELAMVLAYGANSQRLSFAVGVIRNQAKPDIHNPGVQVVKIGPEELANLAGVSEEHAISFLDSRKSAGELDYKQRSIHFFAQAEQLQ